jgi:hypothetical protein
VRNRKSRRKGGPPAPLLWRVVRCGEYQDYMTLVPMREFLAMSSTV